MRPDDPRHGENAGYVAGCRDACCSEAHFRAAKERDLYSLRHGSCRHTFEEVVDLLNPFLRQGITAHAIAHAAGLADSELARTLQTEAPVNRGTFALLRQVTEDKLPDRGLVDAGLTRRRIFSLQAAGHKLLDMPVNPRGKWRDRAKVSIGLAREIRTYFRANEFVMGDSTHTAARARNAGHVVPLAWDDPGTLAAERPRCGTREGYDWHRHSGTPIDGACRRANTVLRATLRAAG